MRSTSSRDAGRLESDSTTPAIPHTRESSRPSRLRRRGQYGTRAHPASEPARCRERVTRRELVTTGAGARGRVRGRAMSGARGRRPARARRPRPPIDQVAGEGRNASHARVVERVEEPNSGSCGSAARVTSPGSATTPAAGATRRPTSALHSTGGPPRANAPHAAAAPTIPTAITASRQRDPVEKGTAEGHRGDA